ncbi:MAG: hypothetical protein KBS44_01505, partial [Clostridiales bacterium]|nr:hypothetical protein [Candidatus Coliplasma equi]
MKKIIALILVCLFAFTALAACGGDEESSEAPFVKSEAESTDTSAEESKEEAAPADESTEESTE